MKKGVSLGFTLMELLVVLVIIAIFSALAIPGIMEIQHRNVLDDTTERVRSAAAAMRDLAMQSRQAATLEVTTQGMWINLLAGPACTSPAAKLCTTQLGDNTGYIDFGISGTNSVADSAGVAMCGGYALPYNFTAGGCYAPVALPPNSDPQLAGFALCYSGSGELWYRLGPDADMTCAAGVDGTPLVTQWFKVCSVAAPQVVTVGGAGVALTDGAAIMLNRFDPKGAQQSCQEVSTIDVPRVVVLPTNGAPFSRIAPSIASGAGNDTDTN